MKRISQSTILLATMAFGFVGGTARAEEPTDQPQPTLVQAEQPAIQAFSQPRTFGSLLQKGQTVTLHQLGQETQYQPQRCKKW